MTSIPIFFKRFFIVFALVIVSASFSVLPVFAASAPLGCLNSMSDIAVTGVIGGWAGDSDSPNTQIDVHIYLDRPPGDPSPYLYAVTKANVSRADNAVIDSLLPGSTVSHGFSYPALTGTHKVYAFGLGVNSNGTIDGNNPLLCYGSGSTYTYSPPIPVVSSITPTSGYAGTQVTVTGSGFTSVGNTISLSGGYPLSKSNLSSNGTSITFTIPSAYDNGATISANTTLGVRVLNANGQSFSGPSFTYLGSSQPTPPPPPPPPTTDIKANGSDGPITIPYNASATISWTSNASSCGVTPTGWSGTSGFESTGNLTLSQTYILKCLGGGTGVSTGISSDSVTVNVASAATPSITVLSPNGREVLTIGNLYSIQWSSQNVPPDTTALVSLIKGGVRVQTFADVNVDDGYLTWTVPVVESAIDFKIELQTSLEGVRDQSDYNFSIIRAGDSPPTDTDTNQQNPQSSCLDLQRNLRYRMLDLGTNNDIRSLQDYLEANGYFHVESTGFFGVLTLRAVKDFQQANGISPTGFVGSITRAKIKELSCPAP